MHQRFFHAALAMTSVSSPHKAPQVLAGQQISSKMRPWRSLLSTVSPSGGGTTGLSEISAMVVTLSKASSDYFSVADTQTSPPLSYGGALFRSPLVEEPSSGCCVKTLQDH